MSGNSNEEVLRSSKSRRITREQAQAAARMCPTADLPARFKDAKQRFRAAKLARANRRPGDEWLFWVQLMDDLLELYQAYAEEIEARSDEAKLITRPGPHGWNGVERRRVAGRRLRCEDRRFAPNSTRRRPR